jgi:hypothetical protein
MTNGDEKMRAMEARVAKLESLLTDMNAAPAKRPVSPKAANIAAVIGSDGGGAQVQKPNTPTQLVFQSPTAFSFFLDLKYNIRVDLSTGRETCNQNFMLSNACKKYSPKMSIVKTSKIYKKW